jgi:hypothetical protein
VKIRLAGTIAAGWVLICLGCAHVESPSGGPEDRDPPRVVGLRPDSAATGATTDTLSIQFNEKMDRGSVRDWLFLSPPIEIRARQWTENRVDVILAHPPDSAITTTVLLGSQVTDRRGNSIGTWEAPFSAGSRLTDGAVEGVLQGGELKSKIPGLYVYAWAWEDSLRHGEPEIPPPVRMTQAAKDGSFRMGFLPRGRPLRICALFDADLDRAYDPEADLWACFDRPIEISDTAGVAAPVEIYVVLPEEPGSIQGSVVDSSCVGRGTAALLEIRRQADSLLVLLAPAQADSGGSLADTLFGFRARPAPPADTLALRARLQELEPRRAAALADSARCALPIVVELLHEDSVAAEARGSGRFEFRQVEPGIYRVRGFRDSNGSGSRDEGEPQAGYPFPVEVLPGRTVKDLEILIAPSN